MHSIPSRLHLVIYTPPAVVHTLYVHSRSRGSHLQPLDGGEVCPEVAGKDPRQRLDVCAAHLPQHLRAVPPQEGHQVLVLQQHVLLQDLDVGLGLPQRIDPAQKGDTDLKWYRDRWQEIAWQNSASA